MKKNAMMTSGVDKSSLTKRAKRHDLEVTMVRREVCAFHVFHFSDQTQMQSMTGGELDHDLANMNIIVNNAYQHYL